MNNNSKTCFKRNGEPRKEFHSEMQAKKSAKHENSLKGEDFFESYKCPKCNLWHLTPKNRKTPNEKCSVCVDSKGDYKALYYSKEGAEKRANIIRREQKIKLSVYKCPHKEGYHLTKS